jgi:hypothetical protein
MLICPYQTLMRRIRHFLLNNLFFLSRILNLFLQRSLALLRYHLILQTNLFRLLVSSNRYGLLPVSHEDNDRLIQTMFLAMRNKRYSHEETGRLG